jgi:signal transduction histidine kinase
MEALGSLRRRVKVANPLLVDAGIATLLATITLIELWTYRDCGCVTASDAGWTAFFMLTQTVPLAFRRRYPFAVLNVAGTSAIVYDVLHIPPDPYTAVFAILLAVYSASAYARRSLAVAAAVILGIALVVLNLPAITPDQDFGDVVNSFVLLGGAWVIGDNTRRRRREVELLAERTSRLEREREEQKQIAALEERGRLARELHDVVAHSVSVIAVQAGAARAVAEQRPDRARQALSSIEEVSKQTMTELRRALGALRSPGDQAALAPTPSLELVEELVRAVRETGVAVEIVREGEQHEIPSGIDLSAFRIVQEALTNVVKHAGPTTAHVVLRYEPEWLDVSVTDDGGSRPDLDHLGEQSGPTSNGHGLVGMRERVEMLGGIFEAGPSGPGFRVRARFPLVAQRVRR